MEFAIHAPITARAVWAKNHKKKLLPTWFEQVTSRRTVSPLVKRQVGFSLALFQLSYRSSTTWRLPSMHL